MIFNQLEQIARFMYTKYYDIMVFFVPDYRSNELWNDTNSSDIILSEFNPLDILFFNKTNDPCGAHLGVYIGNNKVLHNSKDIGKPAVSEIGDLLKISKYKFLLCGKRFRKVK